MNENGGIYGGCFDCEDCKEQNLYCEDCSMYEYDKYRLSNQENNNMRAYELRQHDVISYYPPQPHKQEYKLGEHISINELAEAMFGSPALRLDRDKNEDKMLRVIEIKYVKFPWWKFWKRRKYVEEYYLEVMQVGDRNEQKTEKEVI